MNPIEMTKMMDNDNRKDHHHIIDHRDSVSPSLDSSTALQPHASSSSVNDNHHQQDDNDDEDSVDDEVRFPVLEGCELVARRRAIEVALHSVSQMLKEARDADKFCLTVRELTIQETELRMLNDQSKLDLLRLLDTMESVHKLEFVFRLIDLDRSKNITAIELAKILQLIGGSKKPFIEALKAAQLTITANDSDGDGCLDLEEFTNFIESMGMFMEKTMDDIAHYLIMEFTSMYNGNFIIEETLDNDIFQHKTAFYKKMSNFEKVRIFVLFQLLDSMTMETGYIKFHQVIGAMAPISKQMDKEFRMMLFFVEEDKLHQDMKFPEFLQFVENAMAACPPEMTIDHIVNVMTMHLAATTSPTVTSKVAATTKDSGFGLGISMRSITADTYDESIDIALSKHAFAVHCDKNNSEENIPRRIDPQDKRRILHLFNLWDTSKTQTLDVQELFMGFRKFQKAKDMDETMTDVEDTIKAVQRQGVSTTAGDDRDKITADQFEEIMAHFAYSVNIELHELIDFMYMKTVLHENHKEKTDHHKMELQYAAKAAEKRKLNTNNRSGRAQKLFDMFGLNSAGEELLKGKNIGIARNSTGQSKSLRFSTDYSSNGEQQQGQSVTKPNALRRSLSENLHSRYSKEFTTNGDSSMNKSKAIDFWTTVKQHIHNLKEEEVEVQTGVPISA